MTAPVYQEEKTHRKIRLSLPHQDVNHFTMGRLKIHDEVLQGRKRIPCFTTPSPDLRGRPPPQKHRLKNIRRSSPAMACRPQTVCSLALQRPCNGVREGTAAWIPTRVDRVDGVQHKSRHRLLANSWHMHAALAVLAFMLQFAQGGATTLPSTMKRSASDTVLELGKVAMAHPGPGSQLRRGGHPCLQYMWEQWYASAQAQHPSSATNSTGDATI